MQVKDTYIAQLEAVALPVWEEKLEDIHQAALKAALDSFDTASFGVPGSSELEVLHPASSYLLALQSSNSPGTHLCARFIGMAEVFTALQSPF